ncbi:MAG: hypothetical protein ABI551_15270, partial [Polyangiaceae bacterium]
TISSLAVKVDADNSYETSGEAFVQFDPATPMLAVFVFSPDAKPKPTCDTLALASLNLEAGGFAAIRVRGYAIKSTGTFPITGGGYIAGDVKKHETRMASSGPKAPSLVVRTFDAARFVADVTSEPGAEMQLKGAIVAKVCPDGSLGSAGQPPPTSPPIDPNVAAASTPSASEVDAVPPVTPTKKKKTKKKSR